MKNTYVKTMNQILADGFVPVTEPDETGKMVTIRERIQKIWQQVSTNKFELIETKRTNVNI